MLRLRPNFGGLMRLIVFVTHNVDIQPILITHLQSGTEEVAVGHWFEVLDAALITAVDPVARQ